MNGVLLKPQNKGCLSESAESVEEKFCKVKSSIVEASERRTAIYRQY